MKPYLEIHMKYEVRWYGRHPITLAYQTFVSSGITDKELAIEMYRQHRDSKTEDNYMAEVQSYEKGGDYKLIRSWQKSNIYLLTDKKEEVCTQTLPK